MERVPGHECQTITECSHLQGLRDHTVSPTDETSEKADPKRSKNVSKSCNPFLGIVQFLNQTRILFPLLTFAGTQRGWKLQCHQRSQLILPHHVPRTVVSMWPS